MIKLIKVVDKELIELVVQHPYEENHIEDQLENRHIVEDLMNPYRVLLNFRKTRV